MFMLISMCVCYQRSGDNSKLRVLDQALHEFEALLYAEYPRYLRNINPMDYSLDSIKDKKTKTRYECVCACCPVTVVLTIKVHG